MDPLALYVHVPFCRAVCNYCDFARQVRTGPGVEGYLAALALEFHRSQETLSRSGVRTVFVGGGTPTSLETRELEQLLALIGRHIALSHVEEFTVEANPGTLTPDTFVTLRAHGVNRLSFGVQSFQPRLLKLLGRIHAAEEACQAVESARTAGIANVSIDLMHGLPTGTREELEADLATARALAPNHISAYGLHYEEGTPLLERIARGELTRLEPEEEAAQYRLVMDRLESAGFRQYEISNYARPGCESHHNLIYWRNRPYLGVGPAAASFLDGERRVNLHGLTAWAETLTRGGDPVETRERLEGERRAREALMLALRLREGALPEEFRTRYAFDFERVCADELHRFLVQGLMERTPEGRWRIARAGLPVADAILSELI